MARLKHLRIHADHADVYTLHGGAQKRIFKKPLGFQVVKRKSTVPNPKSYSRAMTLAHVLWPNNFPRILASGTKLSGEAHSKVTYSKRVRLTDHSEAAIHENYEHKKLPHEKVLYKEHDRMLQKHVHTLEERLAQNGVFINYKSMNVGKTKKGFVFFEVGMVNVILLSKYIRTLGEKTSAQRLQKKQALQLVESLKNEADPFGFVVTHVEED